MSSRVIGASRPAAAAKASPSVFMLGEAAGAIREASAASSKYRAGGYARWPMAIKFTRVSDA